jgi:hypothetical protein
MEYLMTYGWAILIIAVVLGALFSLGVFNGSNLAPKASPGACQVFRYQIGSTTSASLQGECQGLEPQYVAQFETKQLNAGSNVTVQMPLNGNKITITAWIKPFLPNPGSTCFWGCPIVMENGYRSVILKINSAGQFNWVVNDYSIQSQPGTIQNTWYFITGTYSGTTQDLYINGALINSNSLSTTVSPSTTLEIGECLYWWCNNQWFNGSIANVQIYNTSLSASQVQALYQEGIGGAPIDPMYLVGWWPLNGNANDYSGNNNNGQATNVIYTSSWTSGYSAP